jgi:predicted  nucleic acid-binding Zn-ribbon protein
LITCGNCGHRMEFDPNSKEVPTECPNCHQNFEMIMAGFVKNALLRAQAQGKQSNADFVNEEKQKEKEGRTIQYGASGEFVITVNPTLESVKFTIQNMKNILGYLRYVEAQMAKADSAKGT